jgi:hypothetical protein
LDDLLTPLRFKVDIDVRGSPPLMGEKPFEGKAESDWIDTGEIDTPTNS